MQLRSKVGTLLEVVSGTNDPLGVFLTLVLTELVLTGAPDLTVLAQFAEQAALGAAFGVAGGFAMVNHVEMPGRLHPLFAITVAVLIGFGRKEVDPGPCRRRRFRWSRAPYQQTQAAVQQGRTCG